jgi:hypothetical protein
MTVQIKRTYEVSLDEEQIELLVQLLERNAGAILGTALSPVFKDLRQAVGKDNSMLL